MSDEPTHQADNTPDNAKDTAQELLSQLGGGTGKLQLIGDTEHNYNPESVLQFLDDVFDGNVPDGAHRLVYASPSNVPGSPMGGVDILERVMRRTTKPRALYYALSSCYPSADGKLAHKTENFAALHGVVFDDVGSKIDPATIPTGLDPTYIIESSAGNYQWGFIFDKPITDVTHAMAVINTVSAAGLTDKGGKVAVKLVRLPEGVNGKPQSAKQTFPVKLNKWGGTVYTPKQLLDRIDFDDGTGKVTWERISQDGYDPLQAKHNTSFLPMSPQGQSTEGVIDDVLEWLYRNKMVVSNSGDGWAEIVCPWHHEHTDGNLVAGFNPFGQGEDPSSRGFNCFHEHCKDKTTVDFLVHIINSSDIPFLAMRMTSWIPHGEYAYNDADGRVVRMTSTPVEHDFSALKRSHSRGAVFGVDGMGRFKQINPVDAWIASPFRITISGIASMPGEAMLFQNEDGNWLNTCKLPNWGPGGYDQAHVDKFIEFINYLVPDVDECAYVLDWLTHKMLDPTFRGTGLVMVASAFGVGRSTFANMIERLLGASNSARVPFADLVSSPFNYWEDKLLVTVDETRDNSANHGSGLFKTYEVLKQRVDTTNAFTSMNVKYGSMRRTYACSSYLILSNHINAIAIPKSDRRLTVITNADVPASKQYFKDLKVWLDAGDWMPHIFRYLVARATTHDTNHPLSTSGKDAMVLSTSSEGVRAAALLAQYCEDEGLHFLTTADMTQVVTDAVSRIVDPGTFKSSYFTHCLNDMSKSFVHLKPRVHKKSSKIRVLDWAVAKAQVVGYGPNSYKDKQADIHEEVKKAAVLHSEKFDAAAALAFIVAEME